MSNTTTDQTETKAEAPVTPTAPKATKAMNTYFLPFEDVSVKAVSCSAAIAKANKLKAKDGDGNI